MTATLELAGRLAGDRRIRYLLAGGVAAVVYYGVFAAGWLLSHHHIPYLAMVVVANFACTVTTYPLYRRVVFRAHGPWLPGFFRFYATCLGSLAFNLGGLPLLVEVLHVPLLPAQALLLVLGPLINYQVNRCWTFAHKR